LWRNVLSDEGRNIARKAEKAQNAGNYKLARELYLKAIAKFREASEISSDFNETSVLRTLASYYRNRASMLEDEMSSNPASRASLQLVRKETAQSEVAEVLKGTEIKEYVFDAVVRIALEIGREGREGHAIGTGFVVGDARRVMDCSRQLVLNPFEGHSREKRMVMDPETQASIKEFAQLDGVFVVSGDGAIESGGRYITIDTGGVKLQKGLGTRHSSVAAITQVTDSIGVVVSQSGGIVRIFKKGKMVATIRH